MQLAVFGLTALPKSIESACDLALGIKAALETFSNKYSIYEGGFETAQHTTNVLNNFR